MNRRQFLALAGAAVGTVGATLSGCASWGRQSTSPGVKLPDMPSQNPAYRGWLTREGGLVLSTRTETMQTIAYRMNANGRTVWSLCDGTRTPEEAAAEYEQRTGRLGTEAAAFLPTMMEIGVVVAGSHIVPAGRFPRPPAGGSYHMEPARHQDDGSA